MDTESELATLDVCTLADALGIGLDLADVFGDDGDVCAVWLGTDDGRTLDFVACTEDRGRDVDGLVRYAGIGATLLDAARVVLWHTDHDLTDGPRLADVYFARRDTLADAGAVLVDEIVLGRDELRSMAITTFTDEPGWDDVSDRLAVGDE